MKNEDLSPVGLQAGSRLCGIFCLLVFVVMCFGAPPRVGAGGQMGRDSGFKIQGYVSHWSPGGFEGLSTKGTKDSLRKQGGKVEREMKPA